MSLLGNPTSIRKDFFLLYLGNNFCHLKNILPFFIVALPCKGVCHVLSPRSNHLEVSVPPFSRFGEPCSFIGSTQADHYFQNLDVCFCSDLFPCQLLSIPKWKFHRLEIQLQFARFCFFLESFFWEQQDGFEMVLYKILFDLGMILGPVYINFVNSKTLKFHLFGFDSKSFFIDF